MRRCINIAPRHAYFLNLLFRKNRGGGDSFNCLTHAIYGKNIQKLFPKHADSNGPSAAVGYAI